MEDINVYEDTGTSESNSETNKAIRKLLDKEDGISRIEKKIIEIEKSTFLTTAAIILGNISQFGVEMPYEKVMDVLKKVEDVGYPLEKFREMNKQGCLHYLKDLKSEIISKLPKY